MNSTKAVHLSKVISGVMSELHKTPSENLLTKHIVEDSLVTAIQKAYPNEEYGFYLSSSKLIDQALKNKLFFINATSNGVNTFSLNIILLDYAKVDFVYISYDDEEYFMDYLGNIFKNGTLFEFTAPYCHKFRHYTSTLEELYTTVTHAIMKQMNNQPGEQSMYCNPGVFRLTKSKDSVYVCYKANPVYVLASYYLLRGLGFHEVDSNDVTLEIVDTTLKPISYILYFGANSSNYAYTCDKLIQSL